MALAPAARAETFTVTTTADSGAGSLREAIRFANDSDDTSNRIEFSDLEGSTIVLAGPLPIITKQLVIDGTTAANLTILGNGTLPILLLEAGTTTAVDVALTHGPEAETNSTILELGPGTKLAFDLSADQTLNERITDLGGIEKLGTAELTLTGANTYTGGTVVTAGTLRGSTRSLPSPVSEVDGSGNIINNARLVFDQDFDGAFSGIVSGSGEVEIRVTGVTGAKILTLEGVFKHTGGTLISEGTLAVSMEVDGANFQGNVDVAEGATLEFAQPAVRGQFEGDISGGGKVKKGGGNKLTLTGTNTYTGGTTILEGQLWGNSDSIQGDVIFESASMPVLVFDQKANGTFTGNISGGGNVVKLGAGSLTLVGRNDYSGFIFIGGGTLIGDTNSLRGNIRLFIETTLIFDQKFFDPEDDGSFDAIISGTGSLEKRGAGRLTLTNAHSFIGKTTVSSGRLDIILKRDAEGVIQPNLLGDVQVDSAAVLGGTGTVAGTATVDGTVAPGTSIGTLSLGNVLFKNGSQLEVEVNDARNGDRLVVTTATFEGKSTVVVRPQPGEYPVEPVPITILSTTGDHSGSFDSFSDDFAFLKTALLQFCNPDMKGSSPNCDLSQVILEINDNGETLSRFADTPNRTAVALGLQEAEDAADLKDLFDNLSILTEADVTATLDAIGGESLTQFSTTRLAISRRVQNSIHRRVRGLGWNPSDPRSGDSADRPFGVGNARRRSGPGFQLSASTWRTAMALGLPASAAPVGARTQEIGPGGWLDAYGIFGDHSGSGGASGMDYTVAGTTVGFDRLLANRGVLGAAVGYARTRNLEFDSLSSSGEANTFHGALYAGRSDSRSYLSVATRFGYSTSRSTRRIVVGSIDRRAEAEFSGWELGAATEAGVDWVEFRGVWLQPLAFFDYVHLQTEEYTETGAGSLNLQVGSQSLDSFVGGLGARLHGTVRIGNDTWMAPELRVRWNRHFGGRGRGIDIQLPAATSGGAWVVRGASTPANEWVVGAGWTVTRQKNLHVFANYDALLNRDLIEHSFALGFRWVW